MNSKLDQLVPIDGYWLIEPNWATNAREILKDTPPSAGVSSDRSESRPDGGYELLAGGIARVVLSGPMTKKPTSASFLFGGCSTSMVRRAVRAAAAADSVKSIVMVVDSPGGQCAGLADLADDIAAAKGKKPVVAYIEDQCCSAALWAASQCTKVYANRTALIGSIGTLAVVEDWSKFYESKGVEVHVVSSGGVKGGGVEGTAITDEHLAQVQKIVDGYTDDFVQAVAKGRGMSPEDVRALATGHVWFPEEAKALGLIDGVATEDDVLTQMQRGDFAARAEAAGNGKLTMKAENQEKTGILARIGSLIVQAVGGPNLDTEAAGAGIPDAEGGATLTLSQAVSPLKPVKDSEAYARIEALEKENETARLQAAAIAAPIARRQADAFADGLVTDGKALPAERDAAAALYLDALAADHSGTFAVDAEGRVAEGAMAARVREAYSARPALKLDATTVSSAEGARTLPASGKDDDFAAKWLGCTDTGRATLKRIGAQGAN